MTKKKNFVELPVRQFFPGMTHFSHTDEDCLAQYVRFRKQRKDPDNPHADVQIPLGKALKGSIVFRRDPDVKNGMYYEQFVRIYRKNTKRSTAPILETRYSRVNVSRSRVTVTMSFPICDDPTRLKARLQNFANIIIDESDEIAAMLNQEGDARVQEAWQTIEQSNEENDDAKE